MLCGVAGAVTEIGARDDPGNQMGREYHHACFGNKHCSAFRQRALRVTRPQRVQGHCSMDTKSHSI
jgi:hypothetical protein